MKRFQADLRRRLVRPRNPKNFGSGTISQNCGTVALSILIWIGLPKRPQKMPLHVWCSQMWTTFKNVNDQEGHDTGDKVLQEVARRLMAVSAHKGDVYRYGGEELLIILPNHSAQEGLAVAERARESISASPIAGLNVTASFGVAVIPDNATSADEWRRFADRAMYEAKNYGRNLVRLFGEPAPKNPGPRYAPRKEATPGTISEELANSLRKKIILGEMAPCPNDGTPLTPHDVTGLGSVGKEFIVMCDDCGFHARLSSPHQRQ
jgi:diguanylate cyclase (GGDEF)-like protein